MTAALKEIERQIRFYRLSVKEYEVASIEESIIVSKGSLQVYIQHKVFLSKLLHIKNLLQSEK